MRRRFTLAAIGLSLLSVDLSAQKPAELKSISVILPVTKSEAYGRVTAAFIDAGLVVTDGSEDGGVITVGPFVPNKYSMGPEAEVMFRANILTADSGSRVILSGTIKVNGSKGAADALTSRWRGAGGKAWKQLEAIAATLGSQSPSPTH